MKNVKFYDFLYFFQKFPKNDFFTTLMVFGPFWGAGTPYPGGENIPLPILHQFQHSKAQKDLTFCFVLSDKLKKMSESITKFFWGLNAGFFGIKFSEPYQVLGRLGAFLERLGAVLGRFGTKPSI